jgi:hypothetical protein
MKAPFHKSIGPIPPGFSAGFDSGSGFVKGLSNALRGQEFKGVGVAPPFENLANLVNMFSRELRETTYVMNTGAEGIPVEDLETICAEEFMDAVTSMYPGRKYPAIMIGSISGAMVHLAAAMGIPLLPQTFMIPVSRPGYLSVDEPKRTMDWGLKPGEAFLKNNPYFKLHHMFDPSQDRLTLEKITYFRVKMLRMLLEYERFIVNNLQEGGTIIVSDCTRKWPVTTISDRFIFQFGALGGATEDEFLKGGERVEKFLENYDSHVRRWDSPEPDSEQPEAEWGFDRMLMDDIERIAGENGFRIRNISYYEPEHPSPFVAELYRWWYRQKGVLANRLVAECFFMHEPYWILRTGSVPFWMKFNMDPSADWLEKYLESTDEYEEIFLMLFSHGVDAIGLAGINRWENILQRARKKHGFLGVNIHNFPRDLGSMIKYNTEFKEYIPSRYNFQVPLGLEQLYQFHENNRDRFADMIGFDQNGEKPPEEIKSGEVKSAEKTDSQKSEHKDVEQEQQQEK